MIKLREFDRARTLYEKYIEYDGSNSSAWFKYAELESQLQDFARTRAIFELGITQQNLSMPELLWKAYIDFEIEEGERETARGLYERLLALSGHVKVWIAYALFEGEPIPIPRAEREDEEDEDEDAEQKTVPGDPELARRVFERAYTDLKGKGLKSEVRNLKEFQLPLSTISHTWAARCSFGSLEDFRRVERNARTSGQGRGYDANCLQAPGRGQGNRPNCGRCICSFLTLLMN